MIILFEHLLEKEIISIKALKAKNFFKHFINFHIMIKKYSKAKNLGSSPDDLTCQGAKAKILIIILYGIERGECIR